MIKLEHRTIEEKLAENDSDLLWHDWVVLIVEIFLPNFPYDERWCEALFFCYVAESRN